MMRHGDGRIPRCYGIGGIFRGKVRSFQPTRKNICLFNEDNDSLKEIEDDDVEIEDDESEEDGEEKEDLPLKTYQTRAEKRFKRWLRRKRPHSYLRKIEKNIYKCN